MDVGNLSKSTALKLVQPLHHSLAAGTSSHNFTISAVDLDKAYIIGASRPQLDSALEICMAYLLDATTVRLIRISSAGFSDCDFFVVEMY